jgi:hypothetical protein
MIALDLCVSMTEWLVYLFVLLVGQDENCE